MVSITIQDIAKAFGVKPVLKNINLTIRAGEFFFLLGPSGCGKTTLLRLLAGFEKPDAGDILFGDRSILALPPHKRNTGMVFQHYALWPHMTVEQNVQYGLDERNVNREDKTRRVQRALERVRMQDYKARIPNQLSGGQQQRVALARALVVEPDVVLLDEPLSNLDARLREEMRDEIRSLHHETGMTMVYVTHDQHEALAMADRMAVMSEGVIEQVGAPADIYERPTKRFVGDFLGAANWMPGVIDSCNGPMATVRVGDVLIRGTLRDGSIQSGKNVLCMVRPERMLITPSAEANRVTATITQTIFLGSATDIHTDAAWGRMRALHAGRLPKDWMTGQTVTMGFAPEDTIIIPQP